MICIKATAQIKHGWLPRCETRKFLASYPRNISNKFLTAGISPRRSQVKQKLSTALLNFATETSLFSLARMAYLLVLYGFNFMKIQQFLNVAQICFIKWYFWKTRLYTPVCSFSCALAQKLRETGETGRNGTKWDDKWIHIGTHRLWIISLAEDV